MKWFSFDIRYSLFDIRYFITPATKYIKVVIPAKAGIQTGTGCPRIKSGAGLSSPA